MCSSDRTDSLLPMLNRRTSALPVPAVGRQRIVAGSVCGVAIEGADDTFDDVVNKSEFALPHAVACDSARPARIALNDRFVTFEQLPSKAEQRRRHIFRHSLSLAKQHHADRLDQDEDIQK